MCSATDKQLFWGRLPDKVHATTPKGIVGGFEFTVFQRSLKEWQNIHLQVVKEINKSMFIRYSVTNHVLIITHITFWDCRMHIFSDNLSRNSYMYINSSNIIPTSPKNKPRMFVIGKIVLPCLGWRLTYCNSWMCLNTRGVVLAGARSGWTSTSWSRLLIIRMGVWK